MKLIIRVFFLAAVSLALVGCSGIQKADVRVGDFQLMPRKAALDLVKRYFPNSDETGLTVSAIGICKVQSMRVNYRELNRLVFADLKNAAIRRTTVFYNYDSWSTCVMGAAIDGLSQAESIELAGAFGSLGAKIEMITTVENK